MATTFHGALISEQGVTFAVVIVKEEIIKSRNQSLEMMRAFRPFFFKLPVVLMAQGADGIPTYLGRLDIVKYLASIDYRTIPWQQFSV
jgi:hypothetical protein